MDRSRNTDGNMKALRRVVAVLLALAALAERCGERSAATRRLVLWLLRPGEAVARDYLAGLTGKEVLPFRPAAVRHEARHGDDGAAEAIRLAQSFRALAAALAALLVHFPAGVFALPRFAIAHGRCGVPGAFCAHAAYRGQVTAVERLDSS